MRTDRFPLRRPPAPRQRDREAVLVLCLIAMALGYVSAGLPSSWLWSRWPALAPTLIALLMYHRFERGQRRDTPEAPYDLALTDDGLSWPRHPGDLEPELLPWSTIDGLMHWGGRRGALLLETPTRTLRIDERLFERPSDLPRFTNRLRLHIARQDDTLEQAHRIERRRVSARAIFRARPLLTYGLLVILVAIYVLEDALGALDQQSRLIIMGANVPGLSLSEAPYRLVSAGLLHAFWLHIGLNALGLLVLGRIIEALMGRQGMWAVFFWSCVGGAAASALVGRGTLSVGASTGLSGLVAALWVLQRRHPKEVPSGIRQSPGAWAVLFGVNLALPVLLPIIDFAGHLGGFLTGLALTWGLSHRRPQLDAPVWPLPTAALALAGVIVCLLGLGEAGKALLERPGDQMARAAGVIAPRLEPTVAMGDVEGVVKQVILADLVNELAYTAATDAHPIPDDGLQRALEGMDRAMSSLERLMDAQVLTHAALWSMKGAYEDTRAALLYRLGRGAEAIDAQRDALYWARAGEGSAAQGQLRLLTTQLMRLYLTDGPDEPIRQQLYPEADAPHRLSAPGLKAGVEVIAIVETEGEPEGLLVLHQGAHAPAAQVAGRALPEGATFRVVYRGPAERSVMAPGHWGWWAAHADSPTLQRGGAPKGELTPPR